MSRRLFYRMEIELVLGVYEKVAIFSEKHLSAACNIYTREEIE